MNQIVTVAADALICRPSNIIAFIQKIQSISGFVGFFERHVHLGQKISPALSVNRFRNIGANAGAAAKNLF